ncbi:ABC transporter substrate-binding protein [Candidatus Entotheonella palauensis]|uniref:ABC transporter substrate-binding protein n=1 Tax=Candidatus Entotheonella palauensis TaxID=93172 RepID=UPI000B7D110C|nr:extracellular solute-binding protein [Candidatus Entotheonella palauensis]
MKRIGLVVLIMVGSLGISLSTAGAQALPGDTVEERAINGAKAYIKERNLQNPSLTMLLISLFKNSMPKYAQQWEELTGVKIKFVEYGYTDIPAKIMAEAVAKTGQYDIFNQFPYVVPDASGAGVIVPLDEYAAKGQPDFSGIEPALRAQQSYNDQLYFLLLDGDHLILVLRQDILDLPGVKEEFKAKFGREAGCPETMAQWEEMATFFHTEKGATRWGKTFEQGLYGAMGYRAINFSYRHFPAYFGSLLFDRDMKPQINTPRGIEAIKAFTSIVRYMPPDIQGWGTPQIYPFWASGQAFSVMSFPSIVGYGNKNPQSKIKGQQLSCIIPGVEIDGKLVRRAPQAAGTGYMVSRYSKHPELAYYFLQWLTGPTKGDEAIADGKGFWDPMRKSNLTNESVIEKFGQQFLETTMANAKHAISLLMLEGNEEYFNMLDKNLALVMQGNMTAEEAAKRIETGWNKITEDVGRKTQIKAWRSGVASGAYIDQF